MDSSQEKIVGAFLGLACGDALGAPAEFHDADYIRKKWGVLADMTGGGAWEPGEWTDDTALALCVADGILAAPDDPVAAAGEGFLAWRKSGPKDIGNTISSVLSAYAGDWTQAAKNSPVAKCGKAAGNGSLMRTLPVALAYSDEETMLRQSARLSAMTHWDPQAEVCCALYNLWVQRLLRGVPKQEAWQDALAAAKHSVGKYGQMSPDTSGPSPLPPYFWPRLEGVSGRTYEQLQPGGYAGYVVDCLEAAAWCVLHADNLEKSLILAVNLGGEADTIAAVVGGAAGAIWELPALPERWLTVLHQRERLGQTALRLAALRRHWEVYAMSDLATRPMKPVEVADRIWTGRNPLTAWDVQTLKTLGITHMLDLREPREWTTPGKFGQEALDELDGSEIKRVSLPVTDVSAPTKEAFDQAAALFNQWLSDPKARIYIHCRASLERTAAVLAAIYAQSERCLLTTL